MGTIARVSSLKESDLQIPEGPLAGSQLREAFRRLFAQINPFFDSMNKLGAKGITIADNLTAEVITGKFSHGVPQQVLLKTLPRVGGGLVLSADGQIAIGPPSVQMVQIPPTAKYGPLASVTLFFGDTAAVNVNCTIILLPEGAQTTAVPVYPAAWIAPTLLNSWVNFGAPFQDAGYTRDSFGLIHLRGLVKSGSASNAVIFTLPPGYRPAKQCLFTGTAEPAAGGGQYARIDVKSNGDVAQNPGVGTSFCSLDGITFDTR